MKANSSLYGIGYHYIVPGNRRIVCCPPKNGCSILKYSILHATMPKLCGIFFDNPSDVHKYAYMINVKSFHDMEDCELFFISRNPYYRAVSAFVSKFICFPEDKITNCITGISEVSAFDMTFRQFITTLSLLPDHMLDPHFVSQSCFLCDDIVNYNTISLDSIGETSYSNFLKTISINYDLFSKAEIDCEKRLSVKSKYLNEVDDEVSSLVDIPVKKLRHMWINGISMNKNNFESDDLRKLILLRYSNDYKLNEFGLNPTK